jgi:hypothetical protein
MVELISTARTGQTELTSSLNAPLLQVSSGLACIHVTKTDHSLWVGESFNYKFELPDAGTYWYHSHSHTQYCDGLRGPMIVYDANDKWMNHYDVDDGTYCDLVKATGTSF